MSADIRLISDALPSYDVGGELGQGGWGVVIAGRHRRLDRRVAIKQLPMAFASDPTVRRRFADEARVLASLDHPHVVPVYDFVEREGLCLLVMEQLTGGTLRSAMTAGGFTAARSVAITLACSAGLNAAHNQGVLHRDVKPENLMFAGTGVIKVTDFGIAKVVGGSQTLATRAGDVLGTPAYIAPEQARGGELSPATDVYALATILYELLTGVLPFTDDGNAMGLLFKHAYEAPTPLSDVAPSVPAAVASVVMRGLVIDPADRFSSVETFGVALAGACTGAWGPGWLSAEPVPVMGASAIVVASERSTAAPHAAVTMIGQLPPLVSMPPEPGPLSDSREAHRPNTPEATEAPPQPAPVAAVPSPRSLHGAQLGEVAVTELFPIQEVVSLPPDQAPEGSGPAAMPPRPAVGTDSASPHPRSEAPPAEEPPAHQGRDQNTARVLGIVVVIVILVLLMILLGPALLTGYQG
ncbi:MAG: serine/threonine-protein kinase [Pseudonocardia sp.]